MRFRVDRSSIYIIPECPEDEAYIEDTLGLKHAGDAIRLVRYDAHDSTDIGHLRTLSDSEYERECLLRSRESLREEIEADRATEASTPA